MTKYHSRKITCDGETFDSQKEYRRWKALRLLERAGQVKDLKRQVRFELIPPQYETIERYSQKTGKRLKDAEKLLEYGCYYIADFVYSRPDGVTVVEDVKGMKTPEYIIKRKLMLYVHGIRILET